MGLFDRFRKRQPEVSLPEISYAAAYFILPHYVFQDFEKLAMMCSEDSEKAGVFFYFMATKLRNATPVKEDAQQFCWHHARIKGGFEHWTLEYPSPPPVDFSDESVEQLMSGEHVLAPYFSTVLKTGNQVDYYILGQAPMGGGTTIRRITPEGMNCNLGPGPKPEMKAFLARLLKNRQAE